MESITKYSLGFENMKKVPFTKYDKDFLFIVGGKEYRISRFLADFLSPIICQHHYQDETMSEFIISENNDDSTRPKSNFVSHDYFEDFLNLLNFDEIELDEGHRLTYHKYFLQLGNLDEYIKLESKISSEITVDSAIQHLNHLTEIKYQITAYQSTICSNINKMIDYLSTHFYDITEEQLLRISEDFLMEILERKTLMISDEDSLLEKILYLYNQDHKYSNLFQFVYFERLSSKMISKFVEEFEMDDLNIGIWCSICRRLESLESQSCTNQICTNNQTKERINRDVLENYYCKYKIGHEFNGIIKYLTDKSGGENIYQKRIIEITSNSIFCSYNSPRNVVNFDNYLCYRSKNEPNSFICFDFRDKQIQLTDYSIQSCQYSSDHLRNWKIEVSNDQNNWETVDEHSNDVSLNDSEKISTFSVRSDGSFYRYIRLCQTGESWSEWCSNQISFAKIEFFGKLRFLSNN